MSVLVTQSCPTLCNPMDCSPPGSPVHGIFQGRTLEWIAISYSRGSSQPRDQTWVFWIADRFFTVWATSTALWGMNSGHSWTAWFKSFGGGNKSISQRNKKVEKYLWLLGDKAGEGRGALISFVAKCSTETLLFPFVLMCKRLPAVSEKLKWELIKEADCWRGWYRSESLSRRIL